MKNIVIGGAWPYANGSLHIGHIAALLPGDVLARYYRAKGNPVFFVSGSDCHGTPVAIRARQENLSPREISDTYHQEFCTVLNKLGFSYDLYGKTSDAFHVDFVTNFHKRLYQSDLVEEKTAPQAYCEVCEKTLTDRFVTGSCPHCDKPARGDQCDACGAVLEAETLLSPLCAECGGIVTFTETKQLYIMLSRLSSFFSEYVAAHPHWRKNATSFTRRYLEEGLRDRAITRDLDWGIDVPKPGYEDKKIYIWAENVLGYLSASCEVAKCRGVPFKEVWGDNARHYYVHGKDNIPFHTIILPALLVAHGEGLRLPDDIVSSEYLTLEGRKISTSQQWAIWVKDVVDRYHPDALRYFLIANGPEKRDTDFSWREFVERSNSELLGSYGNLVNRTLAFLAKYAGNVIPEGSLEEEVHTRIVAVYETTGAKLEEARCKEALETVFEFIRYGNRYYDAQEPWKTRTSAPEVCAQTLYNCVQIVANAAVLLQPFLPFSSATVRGWLGLQDRHNGVHADAPAGPRSDSISEEGWNPQTVPAGLILPKIHLLFERLDPAIIEQERLNIGRS